VVQPGRIQLSRVFCAGLLVVVCVACASDRALAQLETRSIAKIAGEPFNVVSGDFNRDGKLDIAVAGSSLWVLLGKGDGTFQAPVTYSYPLGVPIAVGDFNGDGKLDLVVGSALGSTNGVSVFLGNGDGTFQSPLLSSTTEFPTFIAVGDFNHDHKLDLVLIDPPYISILLGSGDGTFQAPIDNSSFPDYPVWLAVGDFNNDHRSDVAVVGFGPSADVGVLLGNGDGALQPSLTYPLNYPPVSVATGDFNRDGNLDVAISIKFGGVAVLLGNGNGSFQPEVDYSLGESDVVVVDFNGDGKLDLVTAGVYLLLGNGDGTFEPAQLFPAGRSLGSMLVGDFNGDHKPDVIISDTTLGEITMLNTGVVNFSPSSPVSFPSQLIDTTSGPKTVTLTNRGSTSLSISSIKVSGPFRATDTCGGSVAAGASCTINATFSPLKPGLQQGLITIVDSASSKPQVIEVSGMGTALKLSPPALKFGRQKVHTTSPPQQITVTNEGSTTVTFTTIAIGGKDSNDFAETQNCGSQLNAGASCTASITFAPTKIGLRSAVAAFEVVGGANPDSVVLTGTGTN
jgi:hypothetical protein